MLLLCANGFRVVGDRSAVDSGAHLHVCNTMNSRVVLIICFSDGLGVGVIMDFRVIDDCLRLIRELLIAANSDFDAGDPGVRVRHHWLLGFDCQQTGLKGQGFIPENLGTAFVY